MWFYMICASAVGGLFGYWWGLWFLLGRYSRTDGRATPNVRIPLLMSVTTALAFTTYCGRFLGLY